MATRAAQKVRKKSKTRSAPAKPGIVSPLALDSAEPAAPAPGLPFPVVAIGASAGGLAAFTALLNALPPKSGMAFVLIQHLEPKHESALSFLLSKATSMSVLEVKHGVSVQPSHVYVIPPNKNMTIRHGELRLTPRLGAAGVQRPIDEFCMALAEEQGNRAIGVVLSGTGSDGTYGLRAIKVAGGVTFAQDPETAQWPAMPANAIKAGFVDFILPAKRIAAELARIGRHPYLADVHEVPEGSELDKICVLLRSSVDIDFRLYKQATVRRRIARRMALKKFTSLYRYTQVLRQSPDEARALADDIFIHVTSFFRDPACLQALRKLVLAKLAGKGRAKGSARKSPSVSGDEPIRIWSAGCSTGEEAYSIAMLLLEELGERASRTKIQVFGTDILDHEVAFARAGIYTESAVAAVSPARLQRFFVKTDGGYQINKFVRDFCVFARHDLARDPPFSRMNLVSCRNVLIYMGPALQKRVLSVFQYALKPGGSLFLGNSESISEYSDAFAAVDHKHRIFQRKASADPYRGIRAAEVPITPETVQPLISAVSAAVDLRKETEELLLDQFAPPAIVVDRDLRIIHFQGDTSPYLAPATGQPSFHLLKMVRSEFVVDLRTAIYKVTREGVVVRRESVPFEHLGRPAAVRLEVRPLRRPEGRKGDLLVIFQKAEPVSPAESEAEGDAGGGAAPRSARSRTPRSARLERELRSSREHLRALIAEHETAQEEMQAANEEILSSNEELQSTNEELETAKEELQSSNQELVTLNDELQHRNEELNSLTLDRTNLLEGVDIPVLVLDAGLRVRQFTPRAGTLLNLIESDRGRPFNNIASTLNVTDWHELFTQVITQARVVEREVTDREGHRYSMRVRPYRKADNSVEGVLVVILDTDAIYRARDEARQSGDYAHAIVETIHEALAVVGADGRVATVNQSFCDLFRVSLKRMARRQFFGPGAGQCNIPRFRQMVSNALKKGVEFRDIEVDQHFRGIGRRRLVINARRIEKTNTVLIAIGDITGSKTAQEELQRSESTIRALVDSSSQSVIAVNSDRTIVLVNRYTGKMFGYTRDELLGKPFGMLFPGNSRQRGPGRKKAGLAITRARGEASCADVRGRRKDGVTFPVEMALSSIDTVSGKLDVAFISDITQRKKMEDVAQQHAHELHALTASLLTAQEEERRRVSRELHDDVCQQLASLAIDVSGMIADPHPPGQAQERLKELQTRLVRTSETTRHIAYELHPSVLDDLGLVASLRAMCKEFFEREHIPADFRSGALGGTLPREIASCLYRVAQQSLENVARHSGARRASVSLKLRKGALFLSVTDDGRGFDPEAVKSRGGLGLIGMEERANLVKGKLSITSRPGHGSRIDMEVPLPVISP